MIFTKTERSTLIALAGNAIIERVDPLILSSDGSYQITAALERKCGAFVSLYVDKKLRGCIGTFSEQDPLHKSVIEMAVSAATNDSRFPSIHAGELNSLTLEISILTPRQRVFDPSDIVLGKHGIYIKQGSRRGTFLPQVAVSQNWTVREFLGNCSRNKLGIGWEGWKTAEIYTYEAIVFQSERPIGTVKNS